jgi:SAM-dependent methyltransferase
MDHEQLLSYVPKAARRVLDTPCGDGARGRALKARGPVEVVGIEKDPEKARQAHSVLDQVLCANIQGMTLPFADETFDCIVCDDLIACLRDPAPVLKELARVLSRVGLIMLTAPNLRYYETVLSLARGEWTYTDEGILARRHLRFFTVYEVGRLLQTSGFASARCLPLRQATPEELPLNESGCVVLDHATLGPLTEEEYKEFRTEAYLFLSQRI